MWKVLKIHRKELGLQNTLINGQCFNWKKLGDDYFQGVFSFYMVTLKRDPKSDDEILYQTIPDDGNAFMD